jgi:methionyl-tRNA formyltransferase
MFVKCREEWLPLSSVKVEGKKELKGDDFNNGYLLTDSDRLGT